MAEETYFKQLVYTFHNTYCLSKDVKRHLAGSRNIESKQYILSIEILANISSGIKHST